MNCLLFAFEYVLQYRIKLKYLILLSYIIKKAYYQEPFLYLFKKSLFEMRFIPATVVKSAF